VVWDYDVLDSYEGMVGVGSSKSIPSL